MKKILGIHKPPQQHWVGDGFPVRSLFSYSSHAEPLSPFLLLDYAGPARFEPDERGFRLCAADSSAIQSSFAE